MPVSLASIRAALSHVNHYPYKFVMSRIMAHKYVTLNMAYK